MKYKEPDLFKKELKYFYDTDTVEHLIDIEVEEDYDYDKYGDCFLAVIKMFISC